jgi:hypothetical protein
MLRVIESSPLKAMQAAIVIAKRSIASAIRERGKT